LQKVAGEDELHATEGSVVVAHEARHGFQFVEELSTDH
jgi:hypothetical protein